MNTPQRINFDLGRMYKPGVDPTRVKYSIRSERPHDVIEQILAHLKPLSELGDQTSEYHQVITAQKDVPADVAWSSSMGLRMIDNLTRDFLSKQPKAKAYLSAWEFDIRPRLWPILEKRPDLAAWASEFVTKSCFAANFVLCVAEGRLAQALTIASGAFWDLAGELRPIPLDDGAIVAMLEPSLQWVMLRSAYFQKQWANSYMGFDTRRDIHRVLLPGGGCDATLWSRRFHIGSDEEVTLCDQIDYSKELSALLGSDLASNYIRFEKANALEFMGRKDQEGRYHTIVASGLPQYIWIQHAEEFMSNCVRAMDNSEAIVTLDHSRADDSYRFCGDTFPWPNGIMFFVRDFNEAFRVTKDMGAKVGLKVVDAYYPGAGSARTKNAGNEVCEAGAAFVLKRHDG